MNGKIVLYDGTISFDEPWASREQALPLSLTLSDGSVFLSAQAYYVALMDDLTTLAVSTALTHSADELTLTGTINLNTTELVTNRMDSLGADRATYRINIVTAAKKTIVTDDIVVERTEYYVGAPNPTNVAAIAWTDLSDTPAAIEALKAVRGNAAGDELEFYTPSGSGDMLAANNLADVADAPTSFGNIKQAATEIATGVVELATSIETDAGKAVQASDTRLSDERDPAAHAAEHTDGTDDVQTATAARNGVATAAQVTAQAAATAHITADGSSHSYIDQDVTSGAAPTLVGTNITLTPDAEHVHLFVRNVSGSTLTKGTPVYQTGWNAGQERITVGNADADDAAMMPVLGLIEEDLANNANGHAIAAGNLAGTLSANLDTTMWSVGDELFISTTAGVLTSTKPTGATEAIQKVAIVGRSHATLGLLTVFGAGRSNDTDNPTKIHVASTANPHATDVENLGEGTLAELNAAVSDATLDDAGDPRTPSAHTIVSHDTTGTGAQLTSLTNGSDADSLHAHAANDAKITNATHTGDVTGSGALTIATGVVTNAKLATVATATIKGRATAGTGAPEDLTATQARTLLNVADGAAADVWTSFSDNDIDIVDSPATLATIPFAAGESTTWHLKGLIKKTSNAQAFDAMLTVNAVSDGYGGWNYTPILSMIRLAETGDASDVTFFDGSDVTLSTVSGTNALFKVTVASDNWEVAGQYMKVTAL